MVGEGGTRGVRAKASPVAGKGGGDRVLVASEDELCVAKLHSGRDTLSQEVQGLMLGHGMVVFGEFSELVDESDRSGSPAAGCLEDERDEGESRSVTT